MDRKILKQRYEEMDNLCDTMMSAIKSIQEKLFCVYHEMMDEKLAEEDKKDENAN